LEKVTEQLVDGGVSPPNIDREYEKMVKKIINTIAI
jgi:hypothetical protein